MLTQHFGENKLLKIIEMKADCIYKCNVTINLFYLYFTELDIFCRLKNFVLIAALAMMVSVPVTWIYKNTLYGLENVTFSDIDKLLISNTNRTNK